MTIDSKQLHEALLTKAAHKMTRSYEYRFREWLPKNRDAQILDLGCGDGKILWYLAQKYAEVSGVDLDLKKIESAKMLGVFVEHKEVLDFLTHTHKTFDLICALDLLEHLGKERIISFLELCFKRLNSGGRIILQMPNPNSPFGYSVQQADLTHEFTLSPVLALKILNEMGFVNTECRETGPPLWGYSPLATMRFFVWRVIRLCYRFLNFIEAGEREDLPLTRVYLISACKK